MAVRVLVNIQAKAGKGTELAKVRASRDAEVRQEPGCEQFEIFQSTVDPDKLLLVERWTDQASLDAHAERNRQRAPLGQDLRAGGAGGGAEHYTTD